MLMTLGQKAVVLELQGGLMFASAEIVIHKVMELFENADFLILDFSRISAITDGAIKLLIDMVLFVNEKSKTVLFTGIQDIYEAIKRIKRNALLTKVKPLFEFMAVDEALEWCEDQPLEDCLINDGNTVPIEELEVILTMSEYKNYKQGCYICREGDTADYLYLILSGQVSIVIHLDHRRSERIATVSAGAAFGEMGMLDRRIRQGIREIKMLRS